MGRARGLAREGSGMDAVIIVEVLFVGGVALSFGCYELWSLRRLERRRREAERGSSPPPEPSAE